MQMGHLFIQDLNLHLVINKRIDGNGSWLMHDDARNLHNVTDKILLANDGGAEFSGANDKIDMLSNGFKIRSSNAGINGSGNDYVYYSNGHIIHLNTQQLDRNKICGHE